MKETWKIYCDSRRYRKDEICYQGSLWEISDQGRVKKNGKLYECRLHNRCKVFGPGWGVHRAVAELFIHNPNNYNEVDHINGNPLDNRACNLRWCTHQQNMNNPITKRRLSESVKGEKNGFYKHNHTEESRKQLSKQQKNRKMMTNGVHRTYVKLEEIQIYLDNGYHFGRK